MSFHTYMALRYFKSRKGFVSVVSGFSLVGIMLGVAALIVVMSVMNGFRAELMGKILGMSGHATAHVPYAEEKEALKLSVQLQKLPFVENSEVFVQGQALMMNRGAASGVLLRGIDVSVRKSFVRQDVFLLSGDMDQLKTPNTVAIGKELSRKLQVRVGSVLNLVAPQGSTTPFGFIPRMVKVKVVAVYDVGMHLYNSTWVYTSLDTAQKFLQLGDNISGIDLKVSQPMQVESYRTKIEEELANPNALVMTWKNSNQQFFEALEVEKISMFIILTLMVAVAAFNVLTCQMMSVNNKRGEIAILRSMGAKRRDILKIFALGGSLIGVIGTMLGLIAGLLVVFNLQGIVGVLEKIFGVSIFSGEAYFLDELPAVINWGDIGFTLFVSLLLSILAAIEPARRAANLDPVEVLRGE
jgi:lipoprotein-releasing system permease protein